MSRKEQETRDVSVVTTVIPRLDHINPFQILHMTERRGPNSLQLRPDGFFFQCTLVVCCKTTVDLCAGSEESGLVSASPVFGDVEDLIRVVACFEILNNIRAVL